MFVPGHFISQFCIASCPKAQKCAHYDEILVADASDWCKSINDRNKIEKLGEHTGDISRYVVNINYGRVEKVNYKKIFYLIQKSNVKKHTWFENWQLQKASLSFEWVATASTAPLCSSAQS